jgi:predicted acetyltransferase
MKYVKVMFGQTSGANAALQYKVNEVNIANNWNPKGLTPEEMGGFNFSNEESILRWLVRGDTLYDVEIPDDAEIVEINHPTTPHGVFRANKIIIKNPRLVDDKLAMDLYLESNIPEKSYYKALAGLAIRGHINSAKQLIKDRVNESNIDLVLSEFNGFPRPENCTVKGDVKVYEEIVNMLEEIKKKSNKINADNLKLVKLEKKYMPQLIDMMDEWYAAGEKVIPSTIAKVDYHDYEEYIESLNAKYPYINRVPSSTYFCLDTERNIFVGAVNIRHYLNDSLLLCGGHIGDGVRPSERRRGIATAMIKLALEKCKELDIERVLMTCDKDNIGSAKSIMNNGGILENEVMNNGVLNQRYWIDIC